MSRVEHVDRVERVSYNPDVLSCLANLSNDEVFTPPAVVNQMLDLLPQELFASPKTKFLDPATKSGVFLREITKRLIKGLENEIPDLHTRVDHILQTQVFGIATTELTSLVSRRSLYCSKYPNCKYSVSKFDTVEGNIRFRALKHTFVNGRCKWCGASASQFDRDASLESHAYEFIHTSNPEEIFNMKFDVIISNPPYQLNDGGDATSSAPIYQMFVEQAKNMNPRYLIMIIPARWYSGGRVVLDRFRSTMLHDDRIRVIHDFPDASDCFAGVKIEGGVCYFLWDRDSHGLCRVFGHDGDLITPQDERPLLEEGADCFLRYSAQVSILRKVYAMKERPFVSLVSANDPFGYDVRVANSYRRVKPDIKRVEFKGALPIYYFGWQKEGIGYIDSRTVRKGHSLVSNWKVFISQAYGMGIGFPTQVINTPFVGGPQTVCTETYIAIGPFKTKNEASNVCSYIKTRFFRFMVMYKKNTQHAVAGVYQFVPMQNFSKPWADEELYKKYNLTKDEIAFIESVIKPME